jgi:cyclopropane fatty-acyl-phospholipid synthase-like methyltransferase
LNHTDAGDPTYVLGRSDDETKRLEPHAALFKQFTRLAFEEAGITTGMKVLDLGTGSDDVAFLAAELVGSTGRVVGVDLNPAIVATARARAQAAGMTNVSFIVGDVREVELGDDFDAIVGRMVLNVPGQPRRHASGGGARAPRREACRVL